jgi:hypothetical protein
MGNERMTILAIWVFALILPVTSSCGDNGPETGVIRNETSAVTSQIKSANNSSVTLVSPLIPFGTYVASVAGYTSSITFNADGIYIYEDFFTGKRSGTYTISPDHITYYEPVTKIATQQKYSYSDKDKCLYLYISSNPADSYSESSTPFYKQ